MELVITLIDKEEQDWTLISGSWIRVRGMSANGYWRPASKPVDDFETIEKTAAIKAVGDKSGVYYFSSREDFVLFIEYYLRGKILESITEGS